MYYSMVDAVGRVETSIEDVKALLQKRLPVVCIQPVLPFSTFNYVQDEWEAEWRKVVQDLLRQDAGWEYVCLLVGSLPSH